MNEAYKFHQGQFELQNKQSSIQSLKNMAQASIRQRTVSRKQKMTERTMMNLELPKINNKVEQANAFLEDPRQLSKISQTQEEASQQRQMTVQPWMEDNEDSDALRKKKFIKMQIADIMGKQNGEQMQSKIVHEVEQMSPEKIVLKMKKYQPINSSFSLIYGEKKGIEERSVKVEPISQARRRKILNLPPLNFRGHSNHSKAELQSRIQDLYSLRLSKTPLKQPQKLAGYFNKIKEIYKEGNSLHHKSQTLIHRIDKVSQFLQNKFNKFDEQSENMLSDVGSYRLQEQQTGQYKKIMLQGLSQKLRK